MNQPRKQTDPVTEKAIIPVTVYQINEKLVDDVRFEDQNYETISIMGRLEEFNKKDKFAALRFCDGTGQIEGRIYILDGKMSSFAEHIDFESKLNQYFFVVLKPRFSEEGKKFIIVGIKEVEQNYNQISKHYCDVILSYLIRYKNWFNELNRLMIYNN